jgi:alpha-amylase/alpha-mannosidase (GH57 family)
MVPRSVVIHAHFYQPPREDPWLEEVPAERGAAPFHDWNTRIEQECYRAVTAARRTGAGGRIARIVNTLTGISFDAGPTLMTWLARAAPDTYRRFVQADRVSCARHHGHGNAIAAPYHHVILPLASRRDKRTEVRWGLADFRHRFGREAEGCWLPETAVDDETLDVLAECRVAFTIVAPHQVTTPPPDGLPGRVTTAAGRSIALAVYDGGLSHDVAFGPFVRDARRWADALTASGRRLVSIATDGETYGHHHRFGEMALAAVLDELAARPGVQAENFASFLARNPAVSPVTLRAPSSWSCAHGIERWRADCGCRLDAAAWPSQAWRAPLRDGLAELQTGLHRQFEDEGGAIFTDPWAARDAYGGVLCGAADLEAFLDEWAPGAHGVSRARAAMLLEMERHALGMMTSCGWFFDDVSGLESLQVLRYAARAIELAGPAGPAHEERLLAYLARAHSNDPRTGTARDLYDAHVRPLRAASARIAAGVAAAASLGVAGPATLPAGYTVTPEDDLLVVRHRRTGEEARLRVRVERERPGALRVLVGGAGDDPQPLPLDALPEAARAAVSEQLAREVMTLWFTDDESGAVCRGTPVPVVAGRALLRAVLGLEHDASPMGAAQVLDLLDLLGLLDTPVPFDAQTAFAELRDRLPPEAAERAAVIAHRLGFE